MGKLLKGALSYILTKLGLGLATASVSYAVVDGLIDYVQSSLSAIPSSALTVFVLLRFPEAISMIIGASITSNVVKVVKK